MLMIKRNKKTMTKQKAITDLKVPKSKVGLLAVVSAKSQVDQDFKYD